MKFIVLSLVVIFLFLLISGCVTIQVPDRPNISILGNTHTTNTPNPTYTTVSTPVSPEATTYVSPTVSVSQDVTTAEPTSVVTSPTLTTVLTSEIATVQPTESPTQPEPTISYLTSDEINRHLLQIAFGTKRTTIDRWTLGIPLAVSVYDHYLPEDFVTLENFITEFNKLSQSQKLSGIVKEQSKARLNVKFIPESHIKNLNMDDIQEISLDLDDETIIYAISYRSKENEMFAYINEDLRGFERSHSLVRAMLYMLGFAGYTVDQPDSVFYVYSETNTRLSQIDKEAIKLMYGNIMKPGMTQDQVRRAFNMRL